MQLQQLKRLAFIMLIIIFPSPPVNSSQDEIQQFKPSWSIGDVWTVKVDSLTPCPYNELRFSFTPKICTQTYQFKVEKEINFKGESCFQVALKNTAYNDEKIDSERQYWLFLRKDDYTLKAFNRQIRKDERIWKSKVFVRGPISATGRMGSLPMEFPYFSACNFAREVQWSDRSTSRSEYFQPHQKCQLKNIIDNGETIEVISFIFNRNHPAELRTTQIWVKNLPWWIKSLHTQNGTLEYKAELISVNGKPIPAKYDSIKRNFNESFVLLPTSAK